MLPRNYDNIVNDSRKIFIEATMDKLLKGVESTDAGVKEMKSDLYTMR